MYSEYIHVHEICIQNVLPYCSKGQTKPMKVPGFKPMIEDQIEVEIVSSLHPAHIEAQLFKTRTVLDRKNQNARRFQTNGCCLHDISNEMP